MFEVAVGLPCIRGRGKICPRDEKREGRWFVRITDVFQDGSYKIEVGI